MAANLNMTSFSPDTLVIPTPSSLSSSESRLTASISLTPYVLSLRTPFGTSHSASTQRTNALLTLNIQTGDEAVIESYGEVGLPPKKVGCYDSDDTDVRNHTETWWTSAVEQLTKDTCCLGQVYDPLTNVPARYCQPLRNQIASLRQVVAQASSGTSNTNTSTNTNPLSSSSLQQLFILHLFSSLDSYLASKPPTSTDAAFRCLVECTLFDAWGRIIQLPLSNMFGAEGRSSSNDNASDPATSSPSPSAAAPTSSALSLPSHPLPRSFYTVGMDSLDAMLANLDWGLDYTAFIKVKVDHRVDFLQELLPKIIDKMRNKFGDEGDDCGETPGFKISIDANAAWSDASVALRFLDVLRPFARYIHMVEQPFPLFRAKPIYVKLNEEQRNQARQQKTYNTNGEESDHHDGAAAAASSSNDPSSIRMKVVNGSWTLLSDAEFSSWIPVCHAFAEAGLPIYADESICTVEDVRALRPILSGVNVKLEKAGGYRRALSLLHVARHELRVDTWMGVMVGSSLNSTQACALMPFVLPHRMGDMDGALLTATETDRFQGGMAWDKGGRGTIRMEQLSKGGAGCMLKADVDKQ